MDMDKLQAYRAACRAECEEWQEGWRVGTTGSQGPVLSLTHSLS